MLKSLKIKTNSLDVFFKPNIPPACCIINLFTTKTKFTLKPECFFKNFPKFYTERIIMFVMCLRCSADVSALMHSCILKYKQQVDFYTWKKSNQHTNAILIF